MSNTSNDNQPKTIGELQAENERLTESLHRCHALVADYRTALEKAGEATFVLNPKDKRRS